MSLSFSILGSGSAGNCTALFVHSKQVAPVWSPEGVERSCILIDAGLSPRRTHRLLAAQGRSISDVVAVVLTHLDTDHFHPGWLKLIARRARTFSPLTLHV